MLGQTQDIGDFRGVVSDGADRASAQTGPVGSGDEGREHDAAFGSEGAKPFHGPTQQHAAAIAAAIGIRQVDRDDPEARALVPLKPADYFALLGADTTSVPEAIEALAATEKKRLRWWQRGWR